MIKLLEFCKTFHLIMEVENIILGYYVIRFRDLEKDKHRSISVALSEYLLRDSSIDIEDAILTLANEELHIEEKAYNISEMDLILKKVNGHWCSDMIKGLVLIEYSRDPGLTVFDKEKITNILMQNGYVNDSDNIIYAAMEDEIV